MILRIPTRSSQISPTGLSPSPVRLSSAVPLSAPTLAVGPATPRQLAPTRFGLLRFRSPLLTECSLFLRVLRCFTSPSSPLRGYLFTTRCPGIPQGGFPHSDICGSMPYHDSPQLFAVVHVLPRPLAPRHPPYALRSLACCAQERRPRRRSLLTPTAVLLYPIQFLRCQPVCYFFTTKRPPETERSTRYQRIPNCQQARPALSLPRLRLDAASAIARAAIAAVRAACRIRTIALLTHAVVHGYPPMPATRTGSLTHSQL